MLARMETTLQKMEMPKQTRHRKLKVLVMPSELCEFLITVYFCFITMQNFVLLFFKLFPLVYFVLGGFPDAAYKFRFVKCIGVNIEGP
uniref:Uncharacterized protein n=1 Tax=Gopherus agassizii TaxID=38772 RepID=A0A452GG01_9SAUR